MSMAASTLISTFFKSQLGKSTLILHYMSMTTPTLIYTVFHLNSASLRSPYIIWVWQRLDYAHLYFIIIM